ncbi:hypothetical protein JHK82_025117 [Glycine max]|nr:hypothetical protein JHK82_025117 [Glycine max]
MGTTSSQDIVSHNCNTSGGVFTCGNSESSLPLPCQNHSEQQYLQWQQWPVNADEIYAGAIVALDFESAKDGDLTVMSNGSPKRTFKFDVVFGPRQAKQGDIFEDAAPFATSVLDGFNVCIFAYGQTRTGKTFTMEGTEEARGVNLIYFEKMFDIIKERQKLYCYDIYVSVLEAYNEQITYLLVVGNHPGTV